MKMEASIPTKNTMNENGANTFAYVSIPTINVNTLHQRYQLSADTLIHESKGCNHNCYKITMPEPIYIYQNSTESKIVQSCPWNQK